MKMYWLYLIIFSLVAFIPEFVTGPIYIFNEAVTEKVVVFVLTCIGLILYLIREKQLEKREREKSYLQRQLSRVNRDLTNSYTYIGEINRRVDILKEIVFSIPRDIKSKKSDHLLYESIFSSLQMMFKAEKIQIRITDGSKKILKTINSQTRFTPCLSEEECSQHKEKYFETDSCYVACAPAKLEGLSACIIMEKNSAVRKIDDPELIKALASHALFLYAFNQKRNHLSNLKLVKKYESHFIKRR